MQLPELGPETSLRLTRQGGLVVMPGLMRARRIDFAECDSNQRRNICAVLESCLPVASRSVGGADRRFFLVELHYRDHGAEAELTLQIAEELAPPALLRLWRDGEPAGPPS